MPSLLVRGSNSAEVVVDNVSGFTEREDAQRMAVRIIALFDNPKSLALVGETARATIPLSWTTIINQAIERYEQIVAHYYETEE